VIASAYLVVDSPFWREERRWHIAFLMEDLLYSGPTGDPFDFWMGDTRILIDFAKQILTIDELKFSSPQ